MSNKNEPAYPTGDIIRRDDNGNLYGAPVSAVGLTKRELMAMHMMPTMMEQLYSLARRECKSVDVFKGAAQGAVEAADALLEALK